MGLGADWGGKEWGKEAEREGGKRDFVESKQRPLSALSSQLLSFYSKRA